jgi:hypothetical protein
MSVENVLKKHEKVLKTNIPGARRKYIKVIKITFEKLAEIRGVTRKTVQMDKYRGKFDPFDLKSVAEYILQVDRLRKKS